MQKVEAFSRRRQQQQQQSPVRASSVRFVAHREMRTKISGSILAR